MMGPPGFEPESIEPKPSSIDVMLVAV